MNDVPFLYVNLVALGCYLFILITFLAAKKTAVISAFIVVMIGFIFWTGGSILMRLRLFPGIDFWFKVSLMSLIALPLLIYRFIYAFAGLKGVVLKMWITVSTIFIEVLTALGLILHAPAMFYRPGGIVFTYSMSWTIIIPCAFVGFYITAMVFVFRGIIREKGVRAPGLLEILIGGVIVLSGNLLQLMPGNVFPYDTLSGIIFAVMLIWAIYKRRMFRMSPLISRSVITVAGFSVCLFSGANLVRPLEGFLRGNYGLDTTIITIIIGSMFAVMLFVVYWLINRLTEALFIHKEQQVRQIQAFSSEVSKSLETGKIMDGLIGIISEEVDACCVYVCLPSDEGYTAAYSSEQLAKKNFTISAESPCVKYLRDEASYFLLSDFKRSPLYLSVWQEEKDLFQRLSLACMLALKDGDEIVGLVLLSEKERKKSYTFSELDFLDTVASIASIAIKNAGLYEQVFCEARVDSLTGAFNYRYFVERVETEFEKYRNDNLALLFVDIDDFKLYNQLYGSVEGDHALMNIAETIRLCTGEAGSVYRYSGKVFAVLLPGFDVRRTELLSAEIRRRIDVYNREPERVSYKPLSVSCGICVSPYAASSAKELVENADLAVYNAKDYGKDQTITFRGGSPVTQKASDRALSIVRGSSSLSTAYQANTSTISALTAAIDAKDHYTYNHSKNVALYSAILATAVGMNDDQVRLVYEAGLLHDIGKISIPETILSKTGALTDEEYTIMKSHVNNAIDMIRHLPQMDYVIPAAIGHHERWDGRGYPRGLSGEDIPVSARCLAIADAFDAMTTDRPYRRGLAREYAAEQIEMNAGTQFDPELSVIFVALIRSGELSHVEEQYA